MIFPKHTHLPLLLTSALLLLGGCQPDYATLEIEVASSPPLPVSLHSRDFQLPAGIAVLIEIDPRSANRNDYVASDPIEMTSGDRGIVDVDPGPEDRSFVLRGVAPGNTCIEVVIFGVVEDCIPTTVTD